MKPTAQILKYQEKDPRTPEELTELREALIADLKNGDITSAELDKIYKDVTERGKSLASILTTLVRRESLKKLMGE